MSDQDIRLILKYLKKDDIMLEWGSGGSTLYFSKFVKEYYSIESNEKWYNKILKEKDENVSMFFCPPNAGRTVPSQKHQFIDYINQVEKLGKSFDKILIDGRARFFCAEQAFNYLKSDGILFFHDWVREWYHSTLIYYELIELTPKIDNNSGSLAVLKKREYAKYL